MRYASMLLLFCIVGCGGCSDKPKGENVALDLVPEPVMKVAKEKLPGVAFEQAWKTPNGNYEVAARPRTARSAISKSSPMGRLSRSIDAA